MTRLEPFDIGPPRDDGEVRAFEEIMTESLSFPPREELDWVASEGPENMRLARVGGDVAGGLIVRPLGQWFGGGVVPMGALRAVGVAPQHRGSGVGDAMVRHALGEMYERGMPVSTLFPATQPVYRRPGYEQAGAWLTYRVPAVAIDVRDRGLDVRKLADSDRAAVRAVYQERARRTAGHLDRDDWAWGRVLRPRTGRAFGYVVSRDGEVEGYAVFTKHDNGPIRYDLHMTDLVALTVEAGRRLWTLFADHRSMCVNIEWKGAPVDPMLLLLREQTYTIVDRADWMLRVVDVHRALEGRGYPGGFSAELHLEIRDDVIKANDGRLVLTVSDGVGRVQQGGRGALRIDIRGLAALYSGYLTAAELQSAGYVSAGPDELAKASQVFGGPAPWMPDIF